MIRFLVALLLLCCLPACDETSALLVIHSRLKIPAELDALCLQLAGSRELEFSRRYRLTAADAGAPFTLSVVAGERNARMFEVLLRGERRGWQTSWARRTVRFEEGAIKEVDLYVEGCSGSPGAGAFVDGGRLTATAGSLVAAMPVPYAYGQMVAVRAGQAKRFASLEGTVHEKPGGVPSPASTASPRRLLAADLDGDCDTDLLLLLAGAQPAVWLNDGRGAFTPRAAPLPGPGSYLAGAVADLNRDGALDLVLASGSSLTLLLGSASTPGTFRAGAGLLPALGAGELSSLAVGFVNDDAHPDIVLGRRGGAAGAANLLLVNNAAGTGSFTAGPAFSRKDPSLAVALTDLDGDGLHELVVGNGKGTASLVYPNKRGVLDQQGARSLPGTAVAGVEFVLARDLNNDCAADLALASPGGLEVLINKGKLTFKAASLGGAAPACRDLAATDVDGDGDLDLLLGGGPLGAAWMRQK